MAHVTKPRIACIIFFIQMSFIYLLEFPMILLISGSVTIQCKVLASSIYIGMFSVYFFISDVFILTSFLEDFGDISYI